MFRQAEDGRKVKLLPIALNMLCSSQNSSPGIKSSHQHTLSIKILAVLDKISQKLHYFDHIMR